ncbi:Gfo/Idh/MocA family protein [Desertivirga xinjiangensis]|uniref:Gfo/Idh/MocA family protein n=1 Tax=Desertivirga xinjiangensis TaxID=539206 RepID=UPI00210942E9|nr:Gfo/Idh/MocA family oxidoreductase [Pedobacter xinjiangensis]
MIRRDFIRKAGIATGGLILNSQVLNAMAFDLNSEKIKIAIIGCGDRGRGLASVLRSMNDKFEVKSLCDVLDFRLKDAAKPFAGSTIKQLKDYRRILDDREIKAVIIATPLNLHFQIAKDALLAGKHVYLEKTMTYNASEALELAKISRSRPNQILQIGHQYRSTPLYYKVKEMIDKGYLGKVTQIDCRWDRNHSWRRPVPDASLERQINWRMYREYSGGLPAELLSHQIDFINWAFDTHPEEVLASGGIDFYKDGRETFDNVQAILRYKTAGMIGNFGATCSNAHEGYSFSLKGSKGTVSLLIDTGVFYPEKSVKEELETVDGVTGATKIQWNKDGGIPILKEPMKNGSWYALDAFHNSISTGTKPDSDVVTGAKTAFTVHLINQALFSNSIQTWQSSFDSV